MKTKIIIIYSLLFLVFGLVPAFSQKEIIELHQQNAQKSVQLVIDKQKIDNEQQEERYKNCLQELENQKQQIQQLYAGAGGTVVNDSVSLKSEKEILEKIEKFKNENGFHVKTFTDGKSYEGTFENGLFEGKGLFTWPNGFKYEGNFRKGKRSGFGILTFSDGTKYEGCWENDKHNGQGSYILYDGEILDANWKDGEMDGSCIYYFTDGTKEIGNWKNGKKNGELRVYYKNGQLASNYIYKEDKIWEKLVHNKPDGKPSSSVLKAGTGVVEAYFDNGKTKSIVSYKNGEFDGVAKWFFNTGIVWYDCIYKEGKVWDVKAHYLKNGRSTGSYLKNGTGMIYFANKDGSEVIKKIFYENGIVVKEMPYSIK